MAVLGVARRLARLDAGRLAAVACLVGALGATASQAAEAQEGSPESRGYELVSPPYKTFGIGVGLTYTGVGDLSQSGVAAYDRERFAALGHYGSTLLDEGVGFVTNWAFAERTASGWAHHNPLTHPLFARELTRMPGFVAASGDLSRVAWQAQDGGNLPVFPEMSGAGGGSPVFFGDWEGHWEVFSTGGDMATAMSADGSRTVGSGEVFGLSGAGAPDSSPDRLSGRSVHSADTSVTPADTFAGTGARELVNVCTGDGAGRTRLPARGADLKLGERECPLPTPGRSARLISPYGATTLASQESTPPTDSVKNVVSMDGSRVFFMSPDPLLNVTRNPGTTTCTASTGEATACPPQLYVRDGKGAEARVRWISRAAPGLFGSQDASLLGKAIFEGATPDGDKVFFRTTSPLTADDPNGVKDAGGNVVPPPPGGVTTGTASNTSWDLYMYDFPDGSSDDLDAGQLTRITGGPGGLGDCNIPQGFIHAFEPLGSRRAGSLRFVSDDGRRVYFACSASLPGVADSANGTTTSQGGTATSEDFTNVYLYDGDAAATDRYRFIARLPRAAGIGVNSLAQCASTGSYESNPLAGAGSINIDRIAANCWRGTPDGKFVTFFTPGALVAGDDAASGDVYGYDADADALERLSAPEVTGAVSYTCVTSSAGGQPTGAQCFGDGGFETFIKGSARANSPLGVVTQPGAGNDRTAFFQSQSRLVAADVNDEFDVYMWRNGALSLISTGSADAEHAIYKGNDRSGRNVYFTTRDSLTWQDVDAVADVYTARVGGGIPEPPPPVFCATLADRCQAGGAAPISIAPRSQRPAGGDASPRPRKVLVVGRVGSRMRQRAARTGVIRLHVRTNAAGRVRAVARARLRTRRGRPQMRRVARDVVRAKDAGRIVLRLRLSKAARIHLHDGRTLRVKVRVTMTGARGRSTTVRLRRAGS